VHVVNGTIVFETTESEPVELGAGDVVVQSGTRHAWRNPGSTPAQMLAFRLGIDR
jgi:mannose-6-phosphate isomerase-like protein (cupin superfamily)